MALLSESCLTVGGLVKEKCSFVLWLQKTAGLCEWNAEGCKLFPRLYARLSSSNGKQPECKNLTTYCLPGAVHVFKHYTISIFIHVLSLLLKPGSLHEFWIC